MIPPAIIVHDTWRPGIGDPSVFGWLITAAYLAAAGACAHAWRRERRAANFARMLAGGQPEVAPALRRCNAPLPVLRPGLWLLLAGLLSILAVNKQLDLQSLVTVMGRRVAYDQGWYESRGRVQMLFVAAIAAIGVVLLGLMGAWVRCNWRRYLPAIAGLAFLAGFIVVRAASFHHVDRLLFRIPLLGAGLNRLLELAGISIIALAALRAAQTAAPPAIADQPARAESRQPSP